MNDPLIFYSTCTSLAFFINKHFYNDIHFVWCTPVFNPRKCSAYDINSKIPDSSSPYSIYMEFKNAVKSNDLNNLKIKENKKGILKGATIHKSNNNITTNEFARIEGTIEKASSSEFEPRIMIIPYEKVKNKIKEVSVEEVANPLGFEYQIEDLSMGEYDIIQI